MGDHIPRIIFFLHVIILYFAQVYTLVGDVQSSNMTARESMICLNVFVAIYSENMINTQVPFFCLACN